MAAKMELGITDGNQDLAYFWEEIPQSTVMRQRLKCHIVQDVKPILSKDHQSIHGKLLQVMASSRQLEQKLDHYIWTQKIFTVLVMASMALWSFALYIHHSAGCWSWITAKN